MSTIKAGYRISVTSWENDGDNYNTKIVDGLTEDMARFHVDLLKLIAGSHCNDKTVFGNMYDPEDSELIAFDNVCKEVFTKHNQEIDVTEEYEACNYALDIIGDYTGHGAEGFYTRVAQSIVVEYVPQEIVIQDVSSKFGV